MKQISAKTLRDAKWKRVYGYDGFTVAFEIFACDAIPGITITHEREKRFKRKVKTIYTTTIGSGRKTDSPTQAVRYYNEAVKDQTGVRRETAGSPKSAGRPPGDAGL